MLGCEDAGAGPSVRDGGLEDASRVDAAGSDAAPADAGSGGAAGSGAPEDAGDRADGGSVADAGGAPPPVPIVGDDYIDFGTLPVPANGIVRVELDVDSNVRGLVLTADPRTLPTRVSLLSLRGPDGAVFEPASPSNLADGLPYSIGLPISPEQPLIAGHYVIELHAEDVGGAIAAGARTNALHVDAVLQTRAPTTPGRLGLALWSASSALELATLAQDPQLAALLAASRRIFSDADLGRRHGGAEDRRQRDG